MIPAVKVAQQEKTLDLPPELAVPWSYLQRTFGVEGESGNITSNFLCNYDCTTSSSTLPVYKINEGMPDEIQQAEHTFARIFYDIETLALPIYQHMVHAIVSFDQDDKSSALYHLAQVSLQLRHLLKTFYDNLHDGRVSRKYWLSYVQSFQGWGIGTIQEDTGELVTFDGLSGNAVLCFQAVDAFLGYETYLTETQSQRCMPRRQRGFCRLLAKYTPRARLDDSKLEEDGGIADELVKIAKQMKVFRAAHRSRVMPYLEEAAPERVYMTAGKGNLPGASLDDALGPLDRMLVRRFEQTV